MWRYKFYNKSFIGRYVYTPLVGTLWIIILFLAAYNHTQNKEIHIAGLLILCIGFFLFLVAKLSVIKKGVWFTFGMSAAENMTKRMTTCYYGGYLCMIIGFIMSFK